MNRIEKRCIIEYLRDSYRRVNKKKKGVIISELCLRLSVSRKHSIKLLGGKSAGRPKNPGKPGRPSKYQDVNFKNSLRLFWKIMKYPCSRILKSGIPNWIEAVEQEQGKFSEDIRERLLTISAATIDRILKPYKVIKGKTYTRSGGFREEIPILGNIWNIGIPGYMETDTAVMCGGSMSGDFINTLTMVDIATIWTETRAVFGRGSNATFDAIRDIEHCLPFLILGYDSDNGKEVLNKHLYSYFYTERIRRGAAPVRVTRSREYHKNDNAHVEQRQDSLVRKYLGYERLEYKELVPLINYYYAEIVCPLINHFMPCFKLADKIRVKSRTRRVYKAPITPYERLMQSSYLSAIQKLKLKLIHDHYNPVFLSKKEALIRKLIDDNLRRLKAGLGMSSKAPEYKLWMPLLAPLENSNIIKDDEMSSNILSS